MKCELCGRDAPNDGVNLHRVNPKGVKGVWRCWDHLTPQQRAGIDPVVADIIRIIDEDNRKEPANQ